MSFVEKYPKDFISYTEKVSHEKINSYYSKNDIYISLNKRGSLSNTFLEALSNNLYCFRLSSEKESSIDIFTDSFLPDDVSLVIDRFNIVDNLYTKLININLNEISLSKERTKKFVDSNLYTWKERIKIEMEIINSIISKF